MCSLISKHHRSILTANQRLKFIRVLALINKLFRLEKNKLHLAAAYQFWQRVQTILLLSICTAVSHNSRAVI